MTHHHVAVHTVEFPSNATYLRVTLERCACGSERMVYTNHAGMPFQELWSPVDQGKWLKEPKP